MNRLTQDQFRDTLRKGFGRAVLYLREFGPAGFEDDIVHACTSNLVFDAQWEGTRGEWLHEIVILAGMSEMVVPKIIDKLLCPSKAEDFWDVAQLCVLASIFAQYGHEDARKALYSKFDRMEFSDSWLYGIPIMGVDGLQGFMRVAEVIADRYCKEHEYWEDTCLISEACERFGRDIVHDTLAAHAKDNQNIEVFLDQIHKIEKDETELKNREPRSLESLETILSSIESDQDKYLIRLKSWGIRASDSDLSVVFDHMLKEIRPEQLRRYMCVYGWRKMPRLLPQIIELVNTEDRKLLNATIDALSNFQVAEVRNLGLHMLQETPPRLEAIGLFAKNYKLGDNVLLEAVLPIAGDANILHGIGLDLLNVVRETKTPELANCMRWLYEYGPCSMCRNNAIRNLMK